MEYIVFYPPSFWWKDQGSETLPVSCLPVLPASPLAVFLKMDLGLIPWLIFPQGAPCIVTECRVELCLRCIQSSLNLRLFCVALPNSPFHCHRHHRSFLPTMAKITHLRGVTWLGPYQGSLASYESLIHFPAHNLHSLSHIALTYLIRALIYFFF